MTNPEQDGAGQHTRRDFIIKGGIVVAGLVLGRELGVVRVPGVDDLGETSPTDHIYSSGETIHTPGVDVQIEGWKIFVGDEQAGDSSKPFVVRLVGPNESDVGEISNGGGRNVCMERSGDKIRSVLFMEPDQENTPYVLQYTEEPWDAKGPSKEGLSYMVRPRFYTKKDPADDKYELPRVLSENKLSDDTYATINRLSRIFDGWTYPSPVYLRQPLKGYEDLRGGSNEYLRGRIFLPETVFKEPIYKHEGEQKLFHEFGHDIITRLLTDTEDPRLERRLGFAYENWVRTAGFGFPVVGGLDRLFGPISGQEENKLFGLFDESTYFKRKTLRKEVGSHGHPYQNYDEMFASGLTVLHYFPEQMIAGYHRLNKKEQVAASGVIGAIFAVLRNANREMEGIDDLLPAHKELRRIAS